MKSAMTMGELQALLASSPFHEQFALNVVSLDLDRQELRIRMPFSAQLERSPGSRQFHGGAIAVLIDIAGDFALISQLQVPIPTINLRVDYVRPATGAALVAHARIRRIGKTVGIVDVDVEDDEGRLVALGRGCFGTQSG
jgi:uncharacterized protein (TIGR00369 family)